MTPALPLTQPPAPAANLEEQANPMLKVALGVWLLELAIFFSRFFDHIAPGMHIPGICLVLVIFTTLMSGKAFRGLSNPAGRSMAIFFIWVSITLVFSIWKSGSMPSYQALAFSLLYFLVVSGLIGSLHRLRQTIYTLAGSLFVAALMSFVFGAYRTGRLVLEGGTYGDPNQYAMCLLMGIPLWWLIAATSKNNIFKMCCYLCTAPMFWAFFKTGSRGGLLGLLMMLLVLFLQSSASQKVLLVTATAVGFLASGLFLPDYIQKRYKGTFDSPAAVDSMSGGGTLNAETAEYLKSDSESASGRKTLFFTSIAITMRYPIFGVGPGNFPAAVFADAQRQRARYAWLVTHNSYTQISSETGIPGLILFLFILFNALKNLNKVLRLTSPKSNNPRPDLWNVAFYLRLSFMAICVCMFFLSVGFTCEFYTLAGLTIALERVERVHQGQSLPAGPVIPAVMPGFTPRRRAVNQFPQEPSRLRPYSL